VTVFTSGVRHAYLKKRSRSQKFAAAVGMVVVMGVFGFAAKDDEKSAQDLAAEFTEERRCGIVAYWDNPQKGEQASAE